MTDCTKCFWCVQPYGYYPLVCFRDIPEKEYFGDEPKECKNFKPNVEPETTKQKPWQVFINKIIKI